MARKEKKQSEGEGIPGWLITFSDMMTLLLTFFVLLLSMASLTDERKKKEALGSLVGSFGLGDREIDVLATKPGPSMLDPGPMQDYDDLESLKPLIWDDKNKDLNFISNRFIQILTINADVLFEPGQVQLTAKGKKLLNKMVPVLKKIQYPVLLTGHTSYLRDEFGADYMRQKQKDAIDPSWRLSLLRVLNVYRHFLAQGLDPEKIRVEAFGKYRPRYSNQRAAGRKKNRRVEIVLDKRNQSWAYTVLGKTKARQKIEPEKYIYKDFIFELNSTR
ncbi:flagellar motor protein MotB [Desulfovulcanus sp.]